MNALFLLMGLLVLSYLGSFLVGGRAVRGIGLPSGVEYVALGFVIGPHVLDLVGADVLDAFEPIAHVALGWLAVVLGLHFGFAGDRRVRASSLALGLFGALLTSAAVAAATWFAIGHVRPAVLPTQRLLLAGGLGCVCAETTRHAVRWVAERHAARGPLGDRLSELAHADDAVPLLAMSVLFAIDPTPYVTAFVPLRDWPLVSIGLGLALGAAATLLVRRELVLDATWGVLFGTTLLAIGAAARLRLSTLAVCFFVGVAMSVLSRHRSDLRLMVAPTERPVLLPALLLAGARIDLRAMPHLPWIAAAAIAARLVAKLFTGALLALVDPSARRGGPLTGLALVSSGALAMSIGLAFALRFPGPVGDTVLTVAALSATLGEFVGPAALRRVLRAAKEIDDAEAPASGAPRELRAGEADRTGGARA